MKHEPEKLSKLQKLDGNEVAKHKNDSDCWVIIHGKAYDVTEFKEKHPGGKEIILEWAGQDATEPYDLKHLPDTLDKFLDKSKHLGEVDVDSVQQEGPAVDERVGSRGASTTSSGASSLLVEGKKKGAKKKGAKREGKAREDTKKNTKEPEDLPSRESSSDMNPSLGQRQRSTTTTPASKTDSSIVEDHLEPYASTGQRTCVWLCILIACTSIVGLLLVSACCIQESLPDALALHARPICDLAPVPGFCSHARCCIGGIGRVLGINATAESKESSGEFLAEEFGSMYGNFSQVVALGNLLAQEAPKITQKRLDLADISKHLPPGSTAIVPVRSFLNYSLHTGIEWSRYSSNLTRVGGLIVDQYFHTGATLARIGDSPPSTAWLEQLFRAIGWKTSQESLVQNQFKSSIDVLSPRIRQVILAGEQKVFEANEVYELLVDVQSCTKNDLDRCGQEKGDLMKEHHPMLRLFIKAFGAPEPREVGGLTQALTHTDGLVLWANEEKERFQSAVHYLTDVATTLDDLRDGLNEQDRAIRWGPSEEAKVQALRAFMRTVDRTIGPLRFNLDAGDQQRQRRRELREQHVHGGH
ncbi:MAG: hypothetical protein Q9170_002632 [Blastenia crenularia]